MEREQIICEDCGEEIDPETCWCGLSMDGHTPSDNHPPLEMGCNCRRDKPTEFGPGVRGVPGQ